jgi:hypothetical protein
MISSTSTDNLSFHLIYKYNLIYFLFYIVLESPILNMNVSCKSTFESIDTLLRHIRVLEISAFF